MVDETDQIGRRGEGIPGHPSGPNLGAPSQPSNGINQPSGVAGDGDLDVGLQIGRHSAHDVLHATHRGSFYLDGVWRDPIASGVRLVAMEFGEAIQIPRKVWPREDTKRPGCCSGFARHRGLELRQSACRNDETPQGPGGGASPIPVVVPHGGGHVQFRRRKESGVVYTGA